MGLKKAPSGYLADTGIWLEVERGRLSAADLAAIIGSAPVYGSPITIAELTQTTELAPEEAVRARRRATVQRLREKVVLPIDAGTAEIFGRLVNGLTNAKSPATVHRVQDLWLAAQAIQHKLHLITYLRRDFDHVPGLDVLVLPLGVRA